MHGLVNDLLFSIIMSASVFQDHSAAAPHHL